MFDSTVRREKLVNPVSLLLIGLVFGVAFVLLLPGSHTFSLQRGAAEQPAAHVDDLDFAYLKVRATTGDLTDDELQIAVDALIAGGQLDRLENFLQEFEGISLNRMQRYRLDLEKSHAAFVRAGGKAGDNTETAELRNALLALQNHPDLHSAKMVRRALALSKHLQQHDLADAWFRLALADNSPFDASERAVIQIDCGDYFAAHQQTYPAIACYRVALQQTVDADQVFELQVKILPLSSQVDSPREVSSLIGSIVDSAMGQVERQQRAAKALLVANRPDIAHELYAALSQDDRNNADHWLREAARWAEASADPEMAALYLQQVIDTAPASRSSDQREADNRKLQQLWLAAGENEKALEQVYTLLDKQPDNLQALRQGVTLAQQLNHISQALLWNEKILEINPDDIQAIKQQIQLALATQDLDAAENWAYVAVVLEPENTEARRMLARITEWAGRPDEAEQHWQWVARQAGDFESLSQIVRLAEMNFRPARAAAASARLAVIASPTEQDVENMIRFFELDGRPLDAAAALNAIMLQHGHSAYLLTRLGKLHQHHSQYTQALAVWEKFESYYKPTTESKLARTELNWRLNQPQEAVVAANGINATDELAEASDYHVRLLSELAWRYGEPQLGAMVEPELARLEDDGLDEFYRMRRINEAIEQLRFNDAFDLADTAWRDSGELSMGLAAMDLATKTDDPSVIDRYLLDSTENAQLRLESRYWSLLAARLIQQGEYKESTQAYRKALEIDPQDSFAISGLLWQQIGSAGNEELTATLEQFASEATTEPALWSAFAVGFLQVGNAERSLQWFEKLVEGMESDYGLMLTFADALETAGQVETAFKVRRFTVGKLRPILAAASHDQETSILRQYASLVSRYGSVDSNEEWTAFLVDDDVPVNAAERYWREDVGISWLMSTQRHEHARLVMARLHEQRVRTPAWQELSLAMHDRNYAKMQTVLASGERVSQGNRVLALSALGQNRQAMQLARRTVISPASVADRQIAEQQYVYLRGTRPTYAGAYTQSSSTNDLDVRESGLALQHSFAGSNLGIGVEIKSNTLASEDFDLQGSEQRNELVLTLNFGNSRRGGSITSGLIQADDVDVSYASGRYFMASALGDRQLAAEFGFNESATQSSVLKAAALQNRASLEFESSLGAREYLRLRADAHELFTRVNEAKIARGLQARGELGIRGTMGSNNWSTGISVASSRYQLEDSFPSELQLSPSVNFASVIADRSTSVALSASLSRGGVNGEYPQVSSPRYFLNGIVGHAWPEKSFGVQLEGGVGMRVLGGDELSLSFSHDGLANDLAEGDSNATGFGVNYRYHFKH